MKKYFYIVLFSIIFVSVLLVIRPKTPPKIPITPTPTLIPTLSILKPLTFTNSRYFYQYSCPSGSTRVIESTSPYFQETCFQKNDQIRIYVQSISFYQNLKSKNVQNYQESILNGFKTLSYSIPKDGEYFEVYLSPTDIISLRGYGPAYFQYVKTSFKIINFPTPSPKLIPDLKILDTSTWVSQTCQNFSFKSPPQFIVKCNPNSNIIISNGQQSAIVISQKYNGGSRKQFWIDQLNLTPLEVKTLVKTEENMFGQNAGLDFFVDGKDSPILINSGNTIIIILGGRSYDSKTGVITRWDITDTIASTIKLND